jgi:hypothetical protein
VTLLAAGCPRPEASVGVSDPASEGERSMTEMTEHHTDLVLVGERVTISTVGDFRVGYGHFRVRNDGDALLTVAFERVWFEVDGVAQPLTLVDVLDIVRGRNLDRDALEIQPGEELSVFVSFPPFVHNPGWGEQASVIVRVRVGERVYEASSPLEFQRRIPRIDR